MDLVVLHQDAWLLAVHKPAGVLTHNSAYAGPPENSLVDELRRHVEGPLHCINRLDRGCSGAVLLARDADTAAMMQAHWHDATTHKTYRALVRGHVAPGVVDVDHPLTDEHGVTRDARSRVTPVETSARDRCSVVDVQLFTGRTHQVRRHLKHLSHPILGDATYGKGTLNRHYREAYGLTRLGLHAWGLSLVHPHTGASLTLCAPLPQDLLGVLAQLFVGPALKLP